jgi:hypothetical protein
MHLRIVLTTGSWIPINFHYSKATRSIFVDQSRGWPNAKRLSHELTADFQSDVSDLLKFEEDLFEGQFERRQKNKVPINL